MDQDNAELLALARRLTAAYQARDPAALARVYAADALVWHNTDGISMNLADHLSSFQRNTAMVQDLRYTDVVTALFPGGFVQQHVTRGTVAGKSFEIPCCIVCRVQGGKLTRFDEYYDSGALGRAGVKSSH